MANTLPFGIRSLLGHRDEEEDTGDDSRGASSSSPMSDSPVMMSSPEPPMTDITGFNGDSPNFTASQMNMDLSQMDPKALNQLNQMRHMWYLQWCVEQMLRNQLANNIAGGNQQQYPHPPSVPSSGLSAHSTSTPQSLSTVNRETPINYSKTSSSNQCQQRSSGETRNLIAFILFN